MWIPVVLFSLFCETIWAAIVPQPTSLIFPDFNTLKDIREVNLTCINHVKQTLQAAINGELWALHMLDASTKIPDGLFWGNLDQIGNWEECVRVRADDAVAAFQGHYCRVGVRVSNGAGRPLLILRAAVCAPSTCSPEDIANIVQWLLPELLGPLGNVVNVTTHVDPTYCSQDGVSPDAIHIYDYMLIGVYTALIAVVLTATIVDLWGNTPMPKKGLLHLISLRCTISRMRRTNNIKEGQVDCLHGLRVLSMAWIVLGHRYVSYTLLPASNTLDFLTQDLKKPSAMTILNSFLGVDTFFFLSGFLACHLFLLRRQDESFDVFRFYIYRFIRLTVPMAVVILFYVLFIGHVSNGPCWESVIGTLLRDPCKKNWWTSVLYINNYIRIYEQCVAQTWYTSADMQLTWLAPLVLIPLRYVRRSGLQLLGLITLVSCFLPFSITLLNDYPWSAVVKLNQYNTEGFTQNISNPTHTRATPYLVGILTAYILTHVPRSPISKAWAVTGWILNTAMCLAVVYCLTIPYQSDYVYNAVSAAFYAGFHRLGWSIGLAWIVIACERGFGGPVTTILQWKGFHPLSQLTYAVYLTHLAVIFCLTAERKYTAYLSHFEAVYAFFGDIPLIMFSAFLLYSTVEAPLMVMLRRSFGKK